MSDIEIYEYERSLWEKEQAEKRQEERAQLRAQMQAERVARIEREGVDATMNRLDKDRERMAKKAAEARKVRDSLIGVLSPADQHLISTLENKHITLVEFQRKHGLVADGIMGPETQELIEELDYKRKNDAEIQRLAELAGKENHFGNVLTAAFSRRDHPCDAYAHIRLENEMRMHARCDKVDHPANVAHGASFGNRRVRWSDHGDGDGFFIVNAFGECSQVAKFLYDRGNSYAAFLELESAASITRPKEFKQSRSMDAVEAADHVIRAIDAATGLVVNRVEGTKQFPTPDVSKVMVKEGDRAAVKAATVKYMSRIERHNARKGIITKEQYQTRFSEMQYTVVRAHRFGFLAIVTLARGGEWQYRRPTRAWAERVGVKRLKRELAKLNNDYDRSNPTGVRARDIGFHPMATTEEVTALLAEQERQERERAQAEWDAQFNGEEKAS